MCFPLVKWNKMKMMLWCTFLFHSLGGATCMHKSLFVVLPSEFILHTRHNTEDPVMIVTLLVDSSSWVTINSVCIQLSDSYLWHKSLWSCTAWFSWSVCDNFVDWMWGNAGRQLWLVKHSLLILNAQLSTIYHTFRVKPQLQVLVRFFKFYASHLSRLSCSAMPVQCTDIVSPVQLCHT